MSIRPSAYLASLTWQAPEGAERDEREDEKLDYSRAFPGRELYGVVQAGRPKDSSAGLTLPRKAPIRLRLVAIAIC